MTTKPSKKDKPVDVPQDGLTRCPWCESKSLDRHYHDTEWGVPMHNDRDLLELLTLEGAQAGLSWETILNKRENYRLAFDDWDAAKIAQYDADKVAQLLANAGIVRNRLKIAAAITNAQAYLRLVQELGGLDAYLWARHHKPKLVKKEKAWQAQRDWLLCEGRDLGVDLCLFNM